MVVTGEMIAMVCALIFLASFVDSIAGGGGLISLPAYLLAGLPPAMASGTNKLSACAGAFVATARYARRGRLNWEIALFAALGALPAAYAGAYVLRLLPAATASVVLLAMIPVAAALILFKDRLPKPREIAEANRRRASLLIGAAIGFYDGLVGPGTGTFLILLFTALLGLDEVCASGSAKLVNLASNVAALASMLSAGQVLFALGLPAAACSILGGYLGSGLAMRRGAKLIRATMLVVLALMLVKLCADTFF